MRKRIGEAKVVLRLSRGCIETSARLAHRELVIRLLEQEQDNPSPEEEAALELLAEFLESTDFCALRASDPMLAEASGCEVVLVREAGGQVSVVR